MDAALQEQIADLRKQITDLRQQIEKLSKRTALVVEQMATKENQEEKTSTLRCADCTTLVSMVAARVARQSGCKFKNVVIVSKTELRTKFGRLFCETVDPTQVMETELNQVVQRIAAEAKYQFRGGTEHVTLTLSENDFYQPPKTLIVFLFSTTKA